MISEHSRAVIKEFNWDCFVETTQTVNARKVLEKENSVFICGAAGEGKTTCALVLASSFDRDRVVLINNPGQIEQVDPQAVGMIVIDDIFGHFNFDQDKFNAWKQYLEVLMSFVKYSGLKVIITLRTEIWHKNQSEISRLEIFAHVIQLSSKNISSEEKQKILEKHLELNGRKIQSENSEELVGQFSLSFGFPTCANLFASKLDVSHSQEEFFILPYSFIRGMLITMDKEYYATLLFLFYKKEKCMKSDLKPPRRLKMVETNANVTLLNDIAKLVGVSPSKLSLPTVHDNLDNLCDILVKHDDKTYCFINETIYNCIALYHGERYPEEVVENCTVDFLCRYVQAEDNSIRSNTTVAIEQDSFETLAERIIEEVIGNGNTDKIIHCCAFQSKSFSKFLAGTLLEINQIMAFLSPEKDSAGTGDNTVRTGFLATFIEENPDQLCVDIVTQLLDSAKKTDDPAWYNDLKKNSEQLLQEKGYHETLKSVSCLD